MKERDFLGSAQVLLLQEKKTGALLFVTNQ